MLYLNIHIVSVLFILHDVSGIYSEAYIYLGSDKYNCIRGVLKEVNADLM